MTESRRYFLRTSVAGVGGIGLLSATPLLARAAQSRPRLKTQPSQALLDSIADDVANVGRRMAAGTVRARDFHVASAAARHLFRHLNETGVTALLQQTFDDQKEQLLDTPMHDRDITAIHREISNRGVQIPFNLLQRRLKPSPADAYPTMLKLEAEGIQALGPKIEKAFDRLAVRMEKVQQVRVLDDCGAVQEILNMLQFVIAVNAAAALVVPGMIAVAAIEGVIYAVLAWTTSWVCQPAV